jgi:pimeloyl-ACP methyl ester carboxylesterase
MEQGVLTPQGGFVMPVRVFIHGLESSSQGNKGVFFRERYPDMIIEDFEGPLEQRMDKLNDILKDKEDLIVVGSSFGGLMAALYAFRNRAKVRKLILLAPALDLEDFDPCLSDRIDIPVVIFHGKDDVVVPAAEVKDRAARVFPNLEYHLVDDDHPLRKTFTTYDWDELLN